MFLLIMCVKANVEVSDKINLLIYNYTVSKNFNLTSFQYYIFYFIFIYTILYKNFNSHKYIQKFNKFLKLL